ncbi:MAG: hypothetical protein IPK93_09705 [Solirubrobacterales bacterium]|nr:hypothetical protein [Solirubrobacterales bacterium]
MTEGIIDHLRAVDGIRVAAVVRDQVSRGRAARKISLRAGDDHTDVSVLARKFGGGGHVRPRVVRPSWSFRTSCRDLQRPGRTACNLKIRAESGVLWSTNRPESRPMTWSPRSARARGKVGHAGTLDPFATGVLTILLGRATRLQRYLLGLSKTYIATARLGWTSTTGDSDGELTETGVIPEELTLPTGEIEQMVPMTSAVKVDGERLYKRAHRGEDDADRPVRTVNILRAELLESDAERATFEVEVSPGTYVRTLVETWVTPIAKTSAGPRSARSGSNGGRRPDPTRSTFVPAPSRDLAESGDHRRLRPEPAC